MIDDFEGIDWDLMEVIFRDFSGRTDMLQSG
jgi:hypothetical protein